MSTAASSLSLIFRGSEDDLNPFSRRHTPPPGLASGEPDDRLRRGIQYAAASRSIAGALEYWITRFRG
jgi:hypothetical protein